MNIALDITVVQSKNKITGIERVALEVAKNLLKQDNSNNYTILSTRDGLEILAAELGSSEFNDLKSKHKFLVSPFKNRVLTDQVWLPYTLIKNKPDHVFYTTLGIPLLNFFSFSFIIHDAVAWAMPETISKGMSLYYKPLIEKAVKHKRLHKVMTVSEFSKTEIVHYLSVASNKVVVNHLGINGEATSTQSTREKVEEVLQHYNLRKDNYIVSIGTVEPRKNIQGLLSSFQVLKTEYKYDGKLVIIGRKGWENEFTIHNEIADDVLFTGFVESKDMNVLLESSSAYVFPSLYEGFGLPLVEAMNQNVPVLSSNRGSLPEVGGDACVYFDPEDVDEMAEEIHKVISKEYDIKEMLRAASENLTRFSWAKHGETILNRMLGEKQ